MNDNLEDSSPDSTPLGRRRPVFVVLALVFMPIAYSLCSGVVRACAVPDFLGYDFGRAVFRTHLPASVLASALIVAALTRHERPRILVVFLGVFAAIWFGLSASWSLHALPFLP